MNSVWAVYIGELLPSRPGVARGDGDQTWLQFYCVCLFCVIFVICLPDEWLLLFCLVSSVVANRLAVKNLIAVWRRPISVALFVA